MGFKYFSLLAVLTLSGSFVSAETAEQSCVVAAKELKSWSLTLIRYRNETRGWIDFSVVQDWSNSTRKINVDVKETLFECGSKKMIKLQGTIKDPYFNNVFKEKLKFHFHTSANAALTNNGYTAKKLRLNGSGVVITHRPLKNNELFEVKLDNRTTTRGWGNGIGITTLNPDVDDIPDHMNNLKAGTWMLYGKNFWRNGVEIRSSYATADIYTLKVGERIGVMRSDTGALHFFTNGVDQGVVDSNVPEDVYGVYELWGDATEATIMHHS